MKILGIDPGLADIGYGCIDIDGDYKIASWHNEPAGRGKKTYMVQVPGHHLRTGADVPMPLRLDTIFDFTRQVVGCYKPGAVAVEQYIGSVRSSMDSAKIGAAYGAIICGCLAEDMTPAVYLPNVVKKTVSGVGGRACKDDMMWAVETILSLPRQLVVYHRGGAAHVGDAFAIAITHAVIGGIV